jgi:hypothetical protein
MIETMGSPIHSLPLLAMLAGTIGSAQTITFPCAEPAEIHDLSLGQVRARLNAGQDDFFLYKRLEDLSPGRLRRGAHAAEFQQQLQKHPNDARLVYLYGASLVGKNTPDAIVQLNRAMQSAPRLPWTYTALAEVYASRMFRDDAKLLFNVRAYRKLCPANLDGFTYLNKDHDPAETAQWAKQLRTMLEKDSNPNDSEYWSFLWAAEFRVTAARKMMPLEKTSRLIFDAWNPGPNLGAGSFFKPWRMGTNSAARPKPPTRSMDA